MNHRCNARYVEPLTGRSCRCKLHHGGYPELLREHRWWPLVGLYIIHWDAYGNRIER
jgi:hypothetical protein